ncbi:MAG TPA: carboxypeptidase-like regulatory domain-containing protein, partial [Longimicrobium sp.]|nr:carboxypeptidase-like regulatory domain-containing protein [Longimicrobium sp.]
MRLASPLLTLLLLALPAGARAQARVPGAVLLLRVRDERGRPLSDAQVSVGGLRQTGRSNAGGVAFINDIPAGNRLVEVRRPGYAMVRVAADFAAADTVRREVAMTPQPVELEGVVATSWGRSMRLRRSGFYDRQRQGLGAFLGREQLDRMRPVHTVDAFRYVRGYKVLPKGAHQVVVGTRGDGCLPDIYIDGAKMFVRGARDQAQALGMVSPDNIEGIEAFQGPAT